MSGSSVVQIEHGGEPAPELAGEAAALGEGQCPEDRRRLLLFREREALEIELECRAHFVGQGVEFWRWQDRGVQRETARGDRGTEGIDPPARFATARATILVYSDCSGAR